MKDGKADCRNGFWVFLCFLALFATEVTRAEDGITASDLANHLGISFWSTTCEDSASISKLEVVVTRYTRTAAGQFIADTPVQVEYPSAHLPQESFSIRILNSSSKLTVIIRLKAPGILPQGGYTQSVQDNPPPNHGIFSQALPAHISSGKWILSQDAPQDQITIKEDGTVSTSSAVTTYLLLEVNEKK